MSGEVVAPNDTLGAGAETEAQPTAAADPKPEQVTAAAPKPTETVDFWKSKAREQENRAKANYDDAQKWRDLLDKTGKGKDEFDPRAELDQLRSDFASERMARIRAEVSKDTGVDAEDIKGDDEGAMRESAQRYLDRFNTRLEAAIKSKVSPAAAPAAEVTSDRKVEGPKQLTQDDLKSMSHKQILEARSNGQLDDLLGK